MMRSAKPLDQPPTFVERCMKTYSWMGASMMATAVCLSNTVMARSAKQMHVSSNMFISG